ncbi:MAG: hypothetical protein HYT79_12180 [Elusimicrobia bacterium]|nr:hypothetical protein [Elusimicrobiota bacterium]
MKILFCLFLLSGGVAGGPVLAQSTALSDASSTQAPCTGVDAFEDKEIIDALMHGTAPRRKNLNCPDQQVDFPEPASQDEYSQTPAQSTDDAGQKISPRRVISNQNDSDSFDFGRSRWPLFIASMIVLPMGATTFYVATLLSSGGLGLLGMGLTIVGIGGLVMSLSLRR